MIKREAHRRPRATELSCATATPRYAWILAATGLIGCQAEVAPSGRSQQSVSKSMPAAGEFRTAAGCPGCSVAALRELNLAESGAVAYSAKLRDPSAGKNFVVTLSADKSLVSEETLTKEEGAARRVHHGKRTPRLTSYLASASKSALVDTLIWSTTEIPYPAKESLLNDPARLSAHKAETRTKLVAASAPIVAWLRSRGAPVLEDGTSSPLIRTSVSAEDLAILETLPTVAAVDWDRGISPSVATAWHGTVRAEAAGILSAGNVKVCIREGARPNSVADLFLPDSQILAPTHSATHNHPRWVTYMVRNNTYYTTTTGGITYLENYLGAAADQRVQWCLDQGARITNTSGGNNSSAPGGVTAGDWLMDYFVKQYPYPLHVMSAGNFDGGPSSDTVENRGYSYLVVGASNDQGDTDLTNDWKAAFSSWRNPQTVHGDHELPTLVAPGVSVKAGPATDDVVSGTSFSTPIVAGVAALVSARDTATFDGWPEMLRAVLQAAALQTVFYTADPLVLDYKVGVGGINAYIAASIAAPGNYRAPGSAAAARGRYAKTYTFASDFDGGGVSYDSWNIATNTSGRLRVSIAWDSTTTGCDYAGRDCTGDELDADLDLLILDSAGDTACETTRYDSSWESCDFPVGSGETYTVKIIKYASPRPNTYFGIAWTNYNPSTL